MERPSVNTAVIVYWDTHAEMNCYWSVYRWVRRTWKELSRTEAMLLAAAVEGY